MLALVTFTSVAVVGYFLRNRDCRDGVWTTTLAPAAAAVALGVVLVLTLLSFGTVLGVEAGDPAAWALPLAYLVVAVGGAIRGLVLRRTRPEAFARIGTGTRPASVSAEEQHVGTH